MELWHKTQSQTKVLHCIKSEFVLYQSLGQDTWLGEFKGVGPANVSLFGQRSTVEDEENAEYIESRPDVCLCQDSFTFLSVQNNLIYVVKTLKV